MSELDVKTAQIMTLRANMCPDFKVFGMDKCRACADPCKYGTEYVKRMDEEAEDKKQVAAGYYPTGLVNDMKRLKISAVKLAKLIGMSQPTVSGYMRAGGKVPAPDIRAKIRAAIKEAEAELGAATPAPEPKKSRIAAYEEEKPVENKPIPTAPVVVPTPKPEPVAPKATKPEQIRKPEPKTEAKTEAWLVTCTKTEADVELAYLRGKNEVMEQWLQYVIQRDGIVRGQTA